MFLLYKCIIRKKEFFSCFIISILLFGLLFYSLLLSFSINTYINKDKENIKYRTIFIDCSSKILEKIRVDDNVVDVHYNEDNGYYEVIIDNYSNVNSFISFYERDLSYIESYTYCGSKIIVYIKYILKGFIILLSLLISILIILSIFNFIFNFKRDIALYKMIGYNNFVLSYMFLILFLFFYSFMYFMGGLISYLLLFISKYLLLVFNISFDITFWNIGIYFGLYLLLVGFVMISVGILFKKINKISPLMLFKKSS